MPILFLPMQVAQEKEIPVMQASWVEAVFEAMGGKASLSTNSKETHEVLATDQKFLNHVCPVFLNQVVSVSQLTKKERVAIQKLVTDNGGRYSPNLDKYVSILVLLTPQGDKYKAAKEWQTVECVTPDYIYDSVQAGYSLKSEDYVCKQQGSSTPTKGNGEGTSETGLAMC